MSIVGNRSRLIPNDKQSFEMWVELGTCKLVTSHLGTLGIINPDTGLPFSEFTIWLSAMRYVLTNHKEVRDVYKRLNADYAFDDDEWNKWLVKRAMRVYMSSKGRFLSWIKANEFERYHEIYEVRYPPDD